ncbi:Zinc finger protein, partial [Trichinella papuae]
LHFQIGYCNCGCPFDDLHPAMGLEGTVMDVDSSRSVLGAGLAKQRKRGRFCDVHFSVRGRRVSAHRCVLAVRCAYFDTDVPVYNNKDDPIPVSCTTVGLFQQLLDYAYDGTVELNQGNVCEFLTLADMFGVHGLAEQCKTFLKLNLSIDNCAEIFKAVNNMSYQDLTAYVERFIASNADDVLRNSSSSLLALTIDQVLPFLNVVQAGASVETWMEFAFRWTSFDLSARENQFHALLAVKPTALNPNDILPTTTDLLVSDALIAPGSIIIDDQSTDRSLFRCAKCNYSTYSNYRLKKHAMSVHSVAKTFKCQLCDFQCEYNRQFYQHMREHFPGPPFVCDICGHNTRRISLLLDHRLTHTDQWPLECPHCNQRFRTQSNLKCHLDWHAPKTFPCSVCNNSFSSKRRLQIHMRSHDTLRPYHCEHCGFISKYRSHLQTHKRIHSGNVFRCKEPHCNFFAAKRSHLIGHLRTHAGEKKFCCSKCGKAFLEKSHLVRHERIHLEVKPFPCAHCNFSTARRDKLKEHQRRMHPTTLDETITSSTGSSGGQTAVINGTHHCNSITSNTGNVTNNNNNPRQSYELNIAEEEQQQRRQQQQQQQQQQRNEQQTSSCLDSFHQMLLEDVASSSLFPSDFLDVDGVRLDSTKNELTDFAGSLLFDGESMDLFLNVDTQGPFVNISHNSHHRGSPPCLPSVGDDFFGLHSRRRSRSACRQ